MFTNSRKTKYFILVLIVTLSWSGLFKVLAALPDPFLVADINQSPMVGSSPIFLTPLGDQLLFVADDGSLGAELWKTGLAGTSLVEDIAPAPDPYVPYNLKVYNDLVYFTGNDGSGTGEELWVSDGTITGTLMLKDINPVGHSNPTRFTVSNGLLFFNADDGTHGNELWKSDGTITGTVMIKDINPDGADSYPTILTHVGGTLFFVASDADNGEELWKSDGTFDGTVLVKDINPGTSPSSILRLTAVGNTVFFRANDGVHGSELWKSDGTPAGTVMVKDIFPGVENSSPNQLVSMNGALYFSADDGINGGELWESDGTDAGTQMVMDIVPGPGSSNPSSLTVVGDLIYLVAYSPSTGREPWKSDGTQAGTHIIKNIHVSGSSSPLWFVDIAGTVFFQAEDEAHGTELWKTNGTEVSTLLVKDIYTGASSSSPDQFTLVGNKLYFVADDGVHGRELWGLDLENLPPTVDSGGPYAGAEGSPIVLNGTAVDDDLISVEWVSTDPGCVFADTTILDTSVACADNGEFVLTLVVLDWWNVSASDQTTVTVSNAAPQIISLSASDVEAQISQPVEVVVQFSDAGQADTHVANIDWDDGTELEMLVDQVAHFAVASHIYSNPGLFTVRVTVIDDDGASVEGTLEINITQRQLFLPLINR